jgi:multidrug resistance efflux pump
VVASLREHRGRWPNRRTLGRAAAIAAGVVVVAAVAPWPLTVGGRFVAGPVKSAALVAPEEGTVARVFAPEGARVEAGAPVVQLQSFDLQQLAFEYERAADSLANRAAVTRAAGNSDEARQLEYAESREGALLAGTQARIAALRLRTPIAGVVTTPRLEEKIGQWVDTGEVVARVVEADSLELRVALDPAGATLVKPGQAVRLISYADPGRPIRARVTSVATADAAATAAGQADSAVEARIRVPVIPPAWRLGVTGEARIEVRRTSVLGALWWAVRKRV